MPSEDSSSNQQSPTSLRQAASPPTSGVGARAAKATMGASAASREGPKGFVSTWWPVVLLLLFAGFLLAPLVALALYSGASLALLMAVGLLAVLGVSVLAVVLIMLKSLRGLVIAGVAMLALVYGGTNLLGGLAREQEAHAIRNVKASVERQCGAEVKSLEAMQEAMASSGLVDEQSLQMQALRIERCYTIATENDVRAYIGAHKLTLASKYRVLDGALRQK